MNENRDSSSLALRKTRPKSTLSLVNELMNRQIGESSGFEKKLCGSLHMVESLKYSHSLVDHQRQVCALNFNHKGDLLLSASDSVDETIVVWNWATRRKLSSYRSGNRNNIIQAAWFPFDNSSMMVTCHRAGHVQLLDLENETWHELATHFGSCNAFAIHPDTPHIVISVGNDGDVLSSDLRDNETTKLVTVIEGASDVGQILTTIHSNPRNDNEFCVGGRLEYVIIYDRRRANTPLSKFRPTNLRHNNSPFVTSVTYNYDGTEVLASYRDDDIYLFDASMPLPYGDYAHKYEGHRNRAALNGVNYFGPKSEFIVSSSVCGAIFFWEKNTEAVVHIIQGALHSRASPICAELHPYIPVLASGDWFSNVHIWMPSASLTPEANQQRLSERNGDNGLYSDYVSDFNYIGDDIYEALEIYR